MSDLTTESEIDVRVITHTNGDTTVVPADVSDELAAELEALTGDDLAAAVAVRLKQDEDEKAAASIADATQAVVNDPPAPTTAPTSPTQAGPDPVTQGGPTAPTLGVTPPPFTGEDAATTKATEAADPSGGVQAAEQNADGTGPATTTDTTTPAPSGQDSGPLV